MPLSPSCHRLITKSLVMGIGCFSSACWPGVLSTFNNNNNNNPKFVVIVFGCQLEFASKTLSLKVQCVSIQRIKLLPSCVVSVWRNQSGTELGASSLLASIHRAGRCYAGVWGRNFFNGFSQLQFPWGLTTKDLEKSAHWCNSAWRHRSNYPHSDSIQGRHRKIELML